MFRHCFGKNFINMATFKISMCRTDKRMDGDYPITIRVTQNRKSAYLQTNMYVCREQMDKSFEIIDQDLLLVLFRMIKRCKDVVREDYGENIACYTAKEIRDHLEEKFSNSQLDFVKFSREYITDMKKSGRISTATSIEKSLNGFVDYMRRDCILFSEVTRETLVGFGAWLKRERTIIRTDRLGRKLCMHLKGLDDYGVGKYYIGLRGLYYAGMAKFNDEEAGNIQIKRNPFKKLEIAVKAVGLSGSENIPIEDIRKIMRTEYLTSRASFAADVFLLSFMLLGINPADLYEVKEIRDGRIRYNRKKTRNRRKDGALMSVKVEPEMERIIEKYRDKTGERVFDFYKRYANAINFNRALNVGLMEVQKACGISTHLTMYVARRSFATIAKNDLHLPIDFVAEALNHVDAARKVTWGYIEKDFSVVDEGNRRLINHLMES